MKRFQTFAGLLSLLILLIFAGCKDPCKNVDCLNGGVCLEGTCDCENGYEGESCEILSREKMLGNYSVMEVIGPDTFYYNATLTAGQGPDYQVWIYNLYEFDSFYGIATLIEGDAHENDLDILETRVTGGNQNIDLTVVGDGDFVESSGILYIDYEVTDNANGGTDIVSAVFTPQ